MKKSRPLSLRVKVAQMPGVALSGKLKFGLEIPSNPKVQRIVGNVNDTPWWSSAWILTFYQPEDDYKIVFSLETINDNPVWVGPDVTAALNPLGPSSFRVIPDVLALMIYVK